MPVRPADGARPGRMHKEKTGCCGPRLRLSIGSIICNILESIFLFIAIVAACAGFLTYDWIYTDVDKM